MRLRLRPRTEDPIHNSKFSPSLFARLAPSVVRDIAAKAPTKLHQSIDFLPLSVRFNDKTTIYVSYNGGELDGSDNKILDLPPCLIPKGLETNTIVQVSALTSIQDADTLHVEPLTCEDWELLETRAQFLEDGALLQQVSVVYSGQILPIWVGLKQDFAWIRVLPDNFAETNTVWPNLERRDYIRLVQNTRVVVKPKVRCENDPKSIPRLRVFPTREDYSKATNELAESLGKEQISTSPGTVVVNSVTKQKLLRLGIDDTEAFVVVWNSTTGCDSSDGARILQVVFSDLVPSDHIAIHFLTRALLDVSALGDSVFVRVLTPIEVARGSVGSSRSGQDFQLCLQKVELQEFRTEKKWRYPSGGSHEDSLERLFRDEEDREENESFCDEPVQVGSFLLVNSSSEQTCAVYQASLNEDHNQMDQGTGAKEKNSVCFLRRRNLLTVDRSNSTPSLTTALETTFQLHLRPQLLNLLPVTSHIPAGLTDQFSAAIHDVILCGERGSGKTHTALALAAIARFRRNFSTFYLDCKQLKEGQGIRMKDILAELKRVFHNAASNLGDSLIILDDLDELAPNLQDNINGEEASTQTQQVNPVAVDQAKLVGDLIKRQLELRWDRKHPTVIITCEDERSLLPTVVSSRLFTRQEVPMLTSLEREKIIWNMITSQTNLRDRDAAESFKSFRIGRKTEGFRPRDLLLLSGRVRHAMQDAVEDCLPEEVASCTSKVLESFMPLRQQSVGDGASADWSQIGGLSSAKAALTSTILSPAKYRRIYERAQIRLPRGVLVFGPPGSGKSFAIPALAKKCGFALVMCRGPELLGRYIGESESKVRELFARAATSSPSLIFFDEFEALAPRRGSDRTGVTDRVVNQLLTLLDGVEDAKAKGIIYVVAATSRPDIVDPALIRPGRLERHVYFGPPETEDEHTDLILQIASRYAIDTELIDFISSGAFVREAKAANDHFHRLSCADFKAIFDTAQLGAIHELLHEGATDQQAILKVHHVMTALRTTKPSLLAKDHQMLMEIYRPYRKSIVAEDESRDGSSGSSPVRRSRDLRTALR